MPAGRPDPSRIIRSKIDPYERLVRGRIINPEGCWISHLRPAGIGYVYVGQGRDKPKLLAHRLSYERNVGPIPLGYDLDHLCRNRACWNFAHVEPVTRLVNLQRGETTVARRGAPDCINGHAFTLSNTYTNPVSGRRQCRICKRASQRRWEDAIRTT